MAYGEEKSFTTDAFPTFQYGGHTYYVAPDPGNRLTWDAANSYCNSLTLEGLSGWKMPTRDELVQMYADRNSIGGFNTSFGYYWSATSCNGGHYTVNFGNYGNIDCYSDTNRVRPIKRKN